MGFTKRGRSQASVCKILASNAPAVRYISLLTPERLICVDSCVPANTLRSAREQTQARAKPRQTADRSPARRGDVCHLHDASRPASLTFISPRIFGKREGTAHNIRALPRRARARRASAASPQRPARRVRHHGARRRPRAHPQPQGAAHSIQDDGRPPLAFVLSS